LTSNPSVFVRFASSRGQFPGLKLLPLKYLKLAAETAALRGAAVLACESSKTKDEDRETHLPIFTS
jgi:hypothetical protein